jgi:hypothetical protein
MSVTIRTVPNTHILISPTGHGAAIRWPNGLETPLHHFALTDEDDKQAYLERPMHCHRDRGGR